MKVNYKALGIAAVSLVMSGAFSVARADSSDYLTGDWGGVRTVWADAGVDIEAVYTVDLMSNVSGGVRRNSDFLDNLDVTFTFDGEKLYGVEGSTIFLYFLNNNGNDFDGDNVGSVQSVDNIEVGTPTAKLYEAWIEQAMFDDRLSILAGLYDLNSEFYVTDSSGLFLNSTFGIGTDFSQSGEMGPSIFPTTSLAARVKYKPTSESYVQAAIFDGVSGDPGNEKGTQISFDSGDGALLALEGSNNFDFARIAVGGWYYTDTFDDLVDVDALGNPEQEHNNGLYAMAEKEVFDGGTAFIRFGVADNDINQTDYAWSVGLFVEGIIKGRENSQLGLAVSGAHNSNKYKRSVRAGGAQVDNAETGFEIT